MKFSLSRRTYAASLKWRQVGGQRVKDPCYCVTTHIPHPEDVFSEDEPVFTEDQEKWIGTRVDRSGFPEEELAKFFGQFFF